MFNYAVVDAEGTVLGIIVLTDDARRLFLASFKSDINFVLSGGVDHLENKIMNFTVVPEEAKEKGSPGWAASKG